MRLTIRAGRRVTVLAATALVLLFLSGENCALAQSSSSASTSQLFSILRARFQQETPGDIRVGLHDIGAYDADPMYLGMTANRVIVLAKAEVYDSTGRTEIDEYLGIFVFNDSLTTILRTIDMFPSAGEHDYRIARVWADTLTVYGEPFGYTETPFQKKYKLNFNEIHYYK